MTLKKYIALLLIFLTAAFPAWAGETGTVIVQMIRDKYDLQPPEFGIEITSNGLQIAEVEPEEISIHPLSQKDPLGLFTVRVEVKRDGELIERGQVRMRISKFAEVLVALDKVRRYDLLTADQFEPVFSDITELRERPIASVSELTGKRARRNLPRGTLLTTGALETTPDVKSGGDVVIAFTDDWGVITVPGRAMEAGWIGTLMRVKNLATGKVVQAMVMSESTVEVNP
jgi:flagella basal body P-ring formation protein FlgA